MFIIDVVVIVLREIEVRKFSGATFGFIQLSKLISATFHLFILSLQSPMYDSIESKTDGNLCMQNAVDSEILAVLMYEENPYQLYPEVRIVNNPTPISSNLSDLLENDPFLVYPLGKFSPEFNASFQGNAPSIPSTLLNNNINGNAPSTLRRFFEK